MNKVQTGKSYVKPNIPLQSPDKLDELYRPYLIHPTTYMILTEQIMTLMPAERNIILTMNEYDLADINPVHPKTADSPTHVIIFCIRFLSDCMFQPIGALMIYKYENQSKVLAECVKAYINDLWKIGLYVMATVSPPYETFKSILGHLVNIQNFNFYSGVISYSVAPFKEIVHIYDVQFLLIKLQNLFKESDIRFDEGFLNSRRHYQATWTDISYVLKSSTEFKLLFDYFTLNTEVPRRVHIFSEQFYTQLMEAEAKGILSRRADGSLVLLSCIRTFLKFLEQDLVDVKTMTEIHYWNCLIDILQTMQFQKSKRRTCTKETPTSNAQVLKNSTIRRKIDFENDTLKSKQEKVQNSKSRNRKKRKKLNKQNNGQLQKSGRDLREQALSRILNDDATVTVHFFNGFEPARSQTENCDIDKNNNSSSDDCSKTKTPKTSKKKSKSKNPQKVNKSDGTPNKSETTSYKEPSKYPRISVREFGRLSAEEENVLNNENVYAASRQNVLNNNETPPNNTGGLKKSITDILNSLNNVNFYSNFSAKNTNVENENLTNLQKDLLIENETLPTKEISTVCDSNDKGSNPSKSISPSSEYLLNNKPKSYGTLTNSNPFNLENELGKLNLSESDISTDSNTEIIMSELNVSSNQSELNTFQYDFIVNGGDLSKPDFTLEQSKPNDVRCNRTELHNLSLYDNESDVVDTALADRNKSPTNLALNLHRPETTDFAINRSNLYKSSNLSSIILSGIDLSKPPTDFDKPDLSHFECDIPDMSTFDFSSTNPNNGFDLLGRSQLSASSFCDILDFTKDHFCSKSDEETENSIKASCDNVPNILELLSKVDKSPPTNLDNDDFENNSVTFELLCTVYGIERLFNLLFKRRVRVAKPDAFIVEHIDYLVTMIKERNKVSSTGYYGNTYALFNSELALSTLHNNAGLYLVSKE